MAERLEFPGTPVVAGVQGIEAQGEAAARLALWENRLRTVEDIEAQRLWQTSGSLVERRTRAIFDGTRALPVGLPETDAFVQELSRAVNDAGYQNVGPWKDVIEKLRHHQHPSGAIDVLNLLKSPAVAASARWEWFQKEINGILRYTIEKDLAQLRDAGQMLKEFKKEKPAVDEPPLEPPPPQQDEMRTSMDELQEGKEKERGYFSVHPFWGGYYLEDVYETHAGGSRWRKDSRQVEEVPLDERAGLLKERRVYRGMVWPGAITALPMPYGFVPDSATLQAMGSVKLLRDQHGLYSIDARSCTATVAFTVDIGIPVVSRHKASVAPTHLAVKETSAGAESQAMLMGLTGSTIQKARRIKKFVKDTLEYSNDSTLNAVYEAHPQGYFAAIEQYKKADCDVANAYFLNLLSAAGICARMAVGHYVKIKDASGAAVVSSGSRHAWAEVWDEAASAWVRFDATPAGDPTLDDERGDERSEEKTGPQLGDYDEQEAPELSPEELDQWRKKLLEAVERAKSKTPEQIRDKEFAQEAQCTVEEAARVRAKIEAARDLRDKKGRVIRSHLSEEFQRIVETNYKEQFVWKGPVKKSEGDAMDDVVMVGKDVRAGHADPLGYEAEHIEARFTQAYGGMDVYVVADRSGSMNDLDPASQTPKKDEQQLASFLILDSVYGFSYKTKRAALENQLISPLSVRSSVVAFQAGGATTLRPLNSTWKPKEQYDVWKGLESNIGGGTPANLGLANVRQKIEQELKNERKRRERGENVKPRVRMALVFMDGGVDSDKQEDFFAQAEALKNLGVDVSIWGMTASAKAVEGYPNGHCVKSVRDMIEPITEHIIEKALLLKAQSQSDVTSPSDVKL